LACRNIHPPKAEAETVPTKFHGNEIGGVMLLSSEEKNRDAASGDTYITFLK
jgi:hypothetical protein